MEIKVKTSLLKPMKNDSKAIAAAIGYRDEADTRVDITLLEDETLTKLLGVLTSQKDQPHKLAANTIRLYQDTIKNPNIQTPKTLQHLVQCARAYINQAPHLTFFKLSESDSVWLPYVVTKVTYHPKSRDTSVHTTISMAYYTGTKVENSSMSFHQPDLYHKNVAEMLRDKGYIMETPELMAEYNAAVALYQELAPQTGLRVDGYKYGIGGEWRYSRICLETDGVPACLVIDDEVEDDEGNVRRQSQSSPIVDSTFWGRSNFGDSADPKQMKKARTEDDEDEIALEDEEDDSEEPAGGMSKYFTSTVNTDQAVLRLPLHPYIGCFDLRRHIDVSVHVMNLKVYEYDKSIGDRLILNNESKELVSVLIENASGNFEDIIKGKAGGSIVLCAGVPGTGKTLTAEVYAEVMKRPLYTVQCSQLGVEVKGLEKALVKTMRRAMRWKAVLLIDEADVYIHDRGADVNQNAIVGVFLRVLEYYNGVLFMTTNRPDDIDDAISSRATAKLIYKMPSADEQTKIWKVLSKGSKVKVTDEVIKVLVAEHKDLTGRDIKNLLKLAVMLSKSRKLDTLEPSLITYVKQFKQ